jgi:hypothetical protein
VTDGNLLLEGRTIWMVRAAGTPVLVGERLGEGGQGVVHAAQIGGASCAVKWYRAVPKPKELRDSVAALIHNGCPHPAFIWPFDLVVSNEIPGFGYVMPRLDPAFQSLAELLGRTRSPPFRVTSHHLHRDRNHVTVVGLVEAHPTKPGEVVLRNVGPDNWVMMPEGESAIAVPSKRRLGVRTMVIDFGSVQGRISVD